MDALHSLLLVIQKGFEERLSYYVSLSQIYVLGSQCLVDGFCQLRAYRLLLPVFQNILCDQLGLFADPGLLTPARPWHNCLQFVFLKQLLHFTLELYMLRSIMQTFVMVPLSQHLPGLTSGSIGQYFASCYLFYLLFALN